MSSKPRQSESLGRYQPLFEDALGRVERGQMIPRIWNKDASLWKQEEAHQKIIRNSLGWLTVARTMSERTDELESFAAEIRAAGFTHLMLLGMGGSSLCPEVLRRTFGRQDGFPELLVLDTTDPDTIHAFEQRINLAHTLFIVSSKSGTTIEPLSFYKYFYGRVRSVKGESAGENFVAITDPGTLMERMAREANFRRIFLNPSDIGGRYSALSYFGMVPAALMGLDVREMLRRAVVAAVDECGPEVEAANNSGARLGCVMGGLAQVGRDKLTLVAGDVFSSLGLWIEQLVAESTGKEGKGIVPVAGESLGTPDVYGDDRIFVSIQTGAVASEVDDKLSALEAAGHPVVRRTLADALDLGAEFFVWEIATAVAGALMQINPFDQPNVQESKDNTNRLLDEFKSSGALPEQQAVVEDGELKLFMPDRASQRDSATSASLSNIVAEFLARAKAGDYIALLAYIEERDEHDRMLAEIRASLRDTLRNATTVGYGPRFLHSTGQLHKGGADNGLFIQMTDDDRTDLEIPGEPYTFSILKQAQALGDFSSLASHRRRALRLHLGRDAEAGLKKLLEIALALTPDAQSRSAET
jgi:glucose-6-phosphate isomerase